MNIKITELLVKNNGVLPSYTEQEGFPLYYVLRGDRVLCPTCANTLVNEGLNNILANDLEDYQVNWDSDVRCINGHRIDRATIDLKRER